MKLYWLFIDAIDCLAIIKNFIEYIIHYNECPITQQNILLMLLNLQCAQMKVALSSLNFVKCK